jgi:RNA polymerase sigma-70 factor (ECF subfamily)
MAAETHDPVTEDIANELPRLWRYGLVLSGNRDTAEELVQATCVRALERSHQFAAGTRLDRWLISILHSIWLNEVRSR